MEKGKRLKTVDGETLLPEAIIHLIQSFLTRKEAARTALLSRCWYNAWLTRPTLDFDQRDFINGDRTLSEARCLEFATKSMERYQDLNLKIESFRLCCSGDNANELLANKLIVSAMKMGSTDVNLEMSSSTLVLPREVLESETLVRLSIFERKIRGNVRCWRLKSLSLNRVHMKSDDMLRDIISCCLLIEELSLSHCKSSSKMLTLSASNLHELRKLRRLFLEGVSVDALFFTDFECRFPCLKDLSLFCCHGYKSIKIGSTSLERISIQEVTKALRVEFDVQNLVSFSYKGPVSPSLSIQSSRECEFGISIRRSCSVNRSWLQKLKKSLTMLSPSSSSSSKISLYINDNCWRGIGDGCIKLQPLVLENLIIEMITVYSLSTPVLVGLFRFCHPKFITFYRFVSPHEQVAFDKIWKSESVMKQMISDQNDLGQFGLKEVKVEIYKESLKEWRPLLSKEPLDEFKEIKIRFHLRWG